MEVIELFVACFDGRNPDLGMQYKKGNHSELFILMKGNRDRLLSKYITDKKKKRDKIKLNTSKQFIQF